MTSEGTRKQQLHQSTAAGIRRQATTTCTATAGISSGSLVGLVSENDRIGMCCMRIDNLTLRNQAWIACRAVERFDI